jgi:hypothetical protein
MGALLAIPLTLTVKELMPILVGGPAPVQAVDVPVGVGPFNQGVPDKPPSVYADR